MVSLDPRDKEAQNIVSKIIEECGESQEPLRDFYTILWEMEASDKLLSWIVQRDWTYELKKVPGNTQKGVEALAIKLIQTSAEAHEIWRARCRVLHSEAGGDSIDKREAAQQYDEELSTTHGTTPDAT